MKKNYKRKFVYFTIFDYKEEERYLSDMASRGYHLEEPFIFTYKFEVGPPREMTYRLDYDNYS